MIKLPLTKDEAVLLERILAKFEQLDVGIIEKEVSIRIIRRLSNLSRNSEVTK